jgi:hypothetical protein
MTTRDLGRLERLSALVESRNPASASPGIGGAQGKDPVAIRIFPGRYVVPFTVTERGPVSRARPLTRVMPG